MKEGGLELLVNPEIVNNPIEQKVETLSKIDHSYEVD